MGTASIGLSLIVSVVVSAIMIGRIMHVYRNARTSFGGLSPSSSTGHRLSWIASVLLEAAIPLSFAQLVFLVLFAVEYPAFSLVGGPVTIIYVSVNLI